MGSFSFLFFPVLQSSAGQLEKPLENAVNNVVDELFGQGPVPDGSFVLPCPENFNEIGDNTSLRQFILNVTNFALSFLGIIAVIMIIYAGYLYVTAGGGEGAEKAKKIILYAAIGIIVILVSFALVNTLIRNAGKGTDDRLNPQGQIFFGADMKIPDYCKGTGASVLKPTLIDGGLVKIQGDGVIDMGRMAAVSLESAQKGLQFTFTPTGDQTLWDFGDGLRSSEDAPTHKYGTEGAYQINVMKATPDGLVGAAKVLIVGGVTAGFNGPKIVVANQPTVFDGSLSKVVVGSIVSYEWKTEPTDGGFSGLKGLIISPTFTKEGVYKVILKVTSNIGITSEASQMVTVRKDEPIADFNFQSTNNLQKPAEYVFDATKSLNIAGQNTGLQYQWNLDGIDQITTASSLTYTFQSGGDKIVKLTVKDTSTGKIISSEEKTITVTGVKTFAVTFDPPKIALATGKDFSFLAQSSAVTSDVSYEWQFPGEAQFVGVDPATAKNMQEVKAYFSKPGIYDVTLKGKKGDETSDPVTKKIYVQSPGQPLAEITVQGDTGEIFSPALVSRPAHITFASNSVDEQGNIGTSANLTQTWSVDGQVVASADKISDMLTDVKTYTVGLKVSRPGNANVSDTSSFIVHVQNTLPKIDSSNIQYQASGNSNLALNFPVEIIGATDSDGQIVSYTFEVLENGKSVTAVSSKESKVFFNLAPFATNGKDHSFYFRVTVFDNDGATATATNSSVFTTKGLPINHPPKVDRIEPVNGSNVGTTTTQFQFQALASDEDKDALTYAWSISGIPQVFANTQQISYQFARPGNYTVTVKVSDGIATAVGTLPVMVTSNSTSSSAQNNN